MICFLFLVGLHPMTQVGSRRMCLDPDLVPPLAGFRLYAVLGVFLHILSVAPLNFIFDKSASGMLLPLATASFSLSRMS